MKCRLLRQPIFVMRWTVSGFTPVLLGIDKKGEWCYDKEYPTTGVNLVKNDYFSKAEHVYLSSSKSHIQVIEKKSNRVLADFDVVFPIVMARLERTEHCKAY